MNSLRHLREFWSPASQSERYIAGGCHFNYLMQDLAGDRPSHMFASLFFFFFPFPSRHFCLLPPVDPQAAAGHGGRLLPSGSVWLLLAYRHPAPPIRCHQGFLLNSRQRVGCIQSEPGEEEHVWSTNMLFNLWSVRWKEMGKVLT